MKAEPEAELICFLAHKLKKSPAEIRDWPVMDARLMLAYYDEAARQKAQAISQLKNSNRRSLSWL